MGRGFLDLIKRLHSDVMPISICVVIRAQRHTPVVMRGHHRATVW